jgi:hypothetical protein
MKNFNWAQTSGQQTQFGLKIGSQLSFQSIFTRSTSIYMMAIKTNKKDGKTVLRMMMTEKRRKKKKKSQRNEHHNLN